MLSTNAATSISPLADRTTVLKWFAYGLVILAVFRVLSIFSASTLHSDFSHYYLGGWLFANEINAYTEPLAIHCEQLGVKIDSFNLYASHPPLILLLFSLLSKLPPPLAYSVWFIAQLGVFAGFLEVTRRILDWRWSDDSWLLVVAVFVNSNCVQEVFYYSQVQVLVGLMIYLALIAHLKQKHVVACGLVTLAAAFKLYPIVLLPWFFFSSLRAMRDISSRILAVGVAGLACLLLPGVSNWVDFVTIGIPGLSERAMRLPTNFTVQNLMYTLTLTAPGDYLSDLVGGHVKSAAMLASLFVVGGTYLAVMTRRPSSRVAFCGLVAAMTIGGSIAWSHYLTLMLLPVALVWKATDGFTWKTKLLAFAAGGMVFMPEIDLSLFPFRDPQGFYPLGRILLHFYPMFAVVVIGFLVFRIRSNDPSFRVHNRVL